MIHNFVSAAGLAVIVLIAWALSAAPRRVSLRTVVGGTLLQLLFGLLVFCAPGSRRFFLLLRDGVEKILLAATAGQRFVFGPLALGPGEQGAAGERSVGFILAFQALPIIIFFSALMGLLYYAGVMQRVIKGFAWVFTKALRVSGAESLCAASNIFVGIESATTIRPYLLRMTRSEFCTVLTAGMATVASSTLGLYVFLLQKPFPLIAGHLMSASILSAPAAIVMSKVLLPECDEPETLGLRVELHYERESSLVEAVINGAMAGVKLVVGVVALLIAFLGLLQLVDMGLTAAVGKSLAQILGILFAPLAALIGVPFSDASLAGGMLGERLVATEIPAYRHLAEGMSTGAFNHSRSPVIVAYALCGFAHVASLAIFVGGLAALAPERRKDIAQVGPRALLAATLACLMTGAVAGVFFHGGKSILGL